MQLKIDTKDRKIIEQLEANVRQSNNQIARKVGLSKDAVSYRIKNLEKRALIKGYYSVLNISKLGYLTFKLMVTFQNTTSEIENEILNYLKNEKNIGWVVNCDGYYNLMVVGWFENRFNFNRFMDHFLEKYSAFIKERHLLMITENHSCQKNYLFQKQMIPPDIYYGEEFKIELDNKDFKILKLLSENSRRPLNEISVETGLTAEAVSHRIKRLQQNGVIQSFRPIIDASMLGYQYYNVLFKLRRFDHISKIFYFFRTCPNIIYFAKYFGNYDLGIDVEVEDSQQLRELMKKIKDQFSEDIESSNSVLIYKEHKLSYMPC